jgi:hypothetical protein
MVNRYNIRTVDIGKALAISPNLKDETDCQLVAWARSTENAVEVEYGRSTDCQDKKRSADRRLE